MNGMPIDKVEPAGSDAESERFPVVRLRTAGLSAASVLRHFAVALIPAVGTIAAIGLWIAGIGPGVQELLLLAVLYALNIMGMEIALHRYFTHRAFKAGPAMKIALAVLGSLSYMGPLIWWVAIHRAHHANSDKPGDPHTPQLGGPGFGGKLKGLFHGHVGWLFDADSARPENWNQYAKDLYLDPVLLRIHHAYDSWLLLGLLLPAVIGGACSMSWQGALLGFLWGGATRIFLATNAIWAVNSFGHSIGGSRTFVRNDQSRNTFWIALLTLGAGWHNNHHAFPQYASTRFRWWQIDMSGWVIGSLERMGLIWDVRWPDPVAIGRKKSTRSS